MRALHILQTLPAARRAVRSAAVLFALGCGLMWWWAVLGLAIRPEAAGPWQGAMAAGGWSLGLIPLHAVPGVRRKKGAAGPGDSGDGGVGPLAPLTPRALAERVRTGRLSPDAGFRGCVLPGHGHPAIGADDLPGDEGRGV